jgi:hypothetical protein
MTRIACGTLLLFASMSLAQQQTPPYSPPPHSTTPPTFPDDRDRRIPPDAAPAPEAGDSQPGAAPTSAEITDKIQKKLDSEPLLKGSDLKVTVDDSTATLAGTVSSQKDREVALSILALYVGNREIVDRTKLRT